jgi:hypothetical protein
VSGRKIVMVSRYIGLSVSRTMYLEKFPVHPIPVMHIENGQGTCPTGARPLRMAFPTTTREMDSFFLPLSSVLSLCLTYDRLGSPLK